MLLCSDLAQHVDMYDPRSFSAGMRVTLDHGAYILRDQRQPAIHTAQSNSSLLESVVETSGGEVHLGGDLAMVAPVIAPCV